MITFLVYLNAFRDQPQVVYAGICWLVGRFTSTLAHECGHAAAASYCNWRVLTFVVRPFGLQVPNRNLVYFKPKFSTTNVGWITTIPNNLAHGTRSNWALILVAGPAASLLLALVAFGGWATYLRDFDTGSVSVSRIGLGLSFQALYGCVFSILPNSFSDTPSDGTRLRSLHASHTSFERDQPIVWLATLAINKVRLRDRPDWLIDAARNVPGVTAEAAKFLDSHEIGVVLDAKYVDAKRARTLIDQYRAKHGANPWLNACDAYLCAVWEADAQRATATIVLPPSPDEVTPMFLAAEAAVAARSGQTKTTMSKLREMEKALRAASPFHDPTFTDIRSQIKAVLNSN